MSIQRLKKFVTCASMAVVLLLLTTAEASAAILTFLHEGNGSGTLGGNPFRASDFLITAVGDTDDRESFGSGWFIGHTSASISIEGVGVVDFLTPTRHFVNNTVQIVGFSRAGSGTDLFDGPTDPLFGAWDMLSPIGPITGQGTLLQWDHGGGINTTGGILFFDHGSTDTTFTVVPEPGTLAMCVVGGMGLMVRRRCETHPRTRIRRMS